MGFHTDDSDVKFTFELVHLAHDIVILSNINMLVPP
jgi:hypothetical protein